MAKISIDQSILQNNKNTVDESDISSKVIIQNLNAFYDQKQVLFDVTTSFPEKTISAIIGPSGCGKSTLIRTIMRLHELTPKARVEGEILLDGHNIYAQGTNPVLVRRKMGMVFQKPNPFPNMSIYDNVVAGLKLKNITDKDFLDKTVERCLNVVGLGDEISEDDLHKKRGTDLSGGQQQRLCIARAIAVEPEVLLMDEPTSALDPAASKRILQLATTLQNEQGLTIVYVTHNIPDAEAVADRVLLLVNGEIQVVEAAKTFFSGKSSQLAQQFLAGELY